MGINLTKGGNAPLGASLHKFVVGMGWDTNETNPAQDFDLDASAFILGNDGKVLSQAHFIFYGQLKSPEGCVKHTGDNRTGAGDGDDESIKVDLSKIPANCDCITFIVTIHDAEAKRQNFGQVRNAFVRIYNPSTNEEILKFDLGKDYSVETAVEFGTLYKKDGIWKFRAIGAGFAGGLKKFADKFGVILGKGQKVNLQKTGDSHKIDLSKGKTNLIIHANLNWNQNKGSTDKADLDLGCMYQLDDGEIGVVQALGNSFGDKSEFPYIFLDKDDRSGSAIDGENMYVYKPELFDRILFFARIYEGATNFQSVAGKIKFRISNGEIITIKLNNPDSSSKFCAAAIFQNINGEFILRKEELYFERARFADAHYGFGFTWESGHK